MRAVGSGHSFTGAAVTSGVMLRPDAMRGIVSVDEATGLVEVEAGMPLHELNPLLAEHGLALEIMGDIDRQTIAGAVSTGTHGSGRELRQHLDPGPRARAGPGRRLGRDVLARPSGRSSSQQPGSASARSAWSPR